MNYQMQTKLIHSNEVYDLNDNLNINLLEKRYTLLERGQYGIAYSNLKDSIRSILSFIRKGCDLVCVEDTMNIDLIRSVTEELDINLIVDDDIPITSKTFMVWIQTPSQYNLKIHNIRKIVKNAHNYGAIVVVNNSLLSPIHLNPLSLGADIVFNNVTEFLYPYKNIELCLVSCKDECIYDILYKNRTDCKYFPNLFSCYLVLTQLDNLNQRIKLHDNNTREVVKYLRCHSKIERIEYSGQRTHKGYSTLTIQSSGYENRILVCLKKNIEDFIENLKLIQLNDNNKNKTYLHKYKNIIILHIGIEDIKDIINDLDNGLK